VLRLTQELRVIIGILSFTAAFGAAQPVDAPTEFIKPDLAVEGIKGCGFPNVRLRFDSSMDEQVIEVSSASKASELELRCVAQHSLASSTYVNFPEPLNRRYQRVYLKPSQAAGRIYARAWLDRRSLLAKLPTYEKGKTDDLVFARKLEALCGPVRAERL
jgi:hypothetical protein